MDDEESKKAYDLAKKWVEDFTKHWPGGHRSVIIRAQLKEAFYAGYLECRRTEKANKPPQ